MLVGTACWIVHAALHAMVADTTSSGFIGNPSIALLISVLFALWSLGVKMWIQRARNCRSSPREPVASIGMAVLIVGGGGGFARVLQVSGTAGGDGIVCPSRGSAVSWYMPGWSLRSSAFPPVRRRSPSPPAAALDGTRGGDASRERTWNCWSSPWVAAGFLFAPLNDGGFLIVKECSWPDGWVRRCAPGRCAKPFIGLAGLGLDPAWPMR